jgi:hypothetical protein
VGVIEAGTDPDFLQEAIGAKHRGQLGPKHLECDVTVVLQVPGQIDRGHPTGAELALDAVADGQRAAQRRERIVQKDSGGGKGQYTALIRPARSRAPGEDSRCSAALDAGPLRRAGFVKPVVTVSGYTAATNERA